MWGQESSYDCIFLLCVLFFFFHAGLCVKRNVFMPMLVIKKCKYKHLIQPYGEGVLLMLCLIKKDGF